MNKVETYIPETDCRKPRFDVVGSQIDWNGGRFYLTRTVLDLRTVGRFWQRVLFNLFRFTVLLLFALAADLVILLVIFGLKLLGFSVQKSVEQAVLLVRQLVADVFGALLKVLVFSGYLLVLLIFYLKFSQIKHFILSLLK